MTSQDKLISAGLAIMILVRLAIWMNGYSTGKLLYLISFLNLAVAISIPAYRIIKQLNIQKHVFELIEMAVLSFEVLGAVCALYNIVSANSYQPLKVLQYIVFGFDVTTLIVALFFLLTFRMTKLI